MIRIKTYNVVSLNSGETNGFEFYILLLVPGDGTPVTSLQELKMLFFSLSASSVTPSSYNFCGETRGIGRT